MENNLRTRTKTRVSRIVFSLLLILLLVSIRLFEYEWFDDGLLDFFTSQAYLTDPLPHLGTAHLANLMLRYTANAVFSLALLFLWIEDRRIRMFLVKFYALAGGLLFIAFLLGVWFYRPGNYFFLFAVRRLLIQPLFLLILIPVLYATGRDKSFFR